MEFSLYLLIVKKSLNERINNLEEKNQTSAQHDKIIKIKSKGYLDNRKNTYQPKNKNPEIFFFFYYYFQA